MESRSIEFPRWFLERVIFSRHAPNDRETTTFNKCNSLARIIFFMPRVSLSLAFCLERLRARSYYAILSLWRWAVKWPFFISFTLSARLRDLKFALISKILRSRWWCIRHCKVLLPLCLLKEWNFHKIWSLVCFSLRFLVYPNDFDDWIKLSFLRSCKNFKFEI